MNDRKKKDKIITTSFKPVNDLDVSRAYLLEKLTKVEGQLSLLETVFSEFELDSAKQSVEKTLIERAVETSIQIIYDKVLFDEYDIEDEVLKENFLVERRKPDLEDSER